MPAATVTEYLAALPADRREALNEVRRGINRALPPGYKEGIQFGMISWFVPLSTYPAGYGGNKKVPLPLISVASQKGYMALHMICFYGQPALRELALDVVEKTLARLPVKDYVAGYEAMRKPLRGKAPNPKRQAPKKREK